MWGNNVELFEVFNVWRAQRLQMLEAGLNPRTGAPFEHPLTRQRLTLQEARVVLQPQLGLREAAETKADFATFLWEPLAASWYEGWDTVESQYDKFTGKISMRTFDEVRWKRFNGLTGIGKVGESGGYPSLRRGFGPEFGMVMDTYGAEYSMTRKLIRSHGVERLLERNPRDIGEALADWLTRLVVGFIVSNPNAPDGTAMAHSSRGNSFTDAPTADSVVDIAVWFRGRRTDDGRPIRQRIETAVVQNDRPAIILDQILNSAEHDTQSTGVGATALGRGTRNPLAGRQMIGEILIDQWFPDARTIHYFGNTDAHAAFRRAHLDGEERPMIGMADETVMHLANSNASGFDPYTLQGDAITYKGRTDVGLAAHEPMTYAKQAWA